MTKQLNVDQKLAVSRIGGLVVINAMIFQETLAGIDSRVKPINKILSGPDPIDEFAEHWEFIYKEIDYYPIFHLARDILLGLTASGDMLEAIKKLADSARSIITNRAALRHDLMGRIYHRLLVEAKYLGTYYTSIPSAVMLLKLALRPDAWNIEWDDIDQIAELRISDLACGTGTLLMAAADAITDNYVAATHGTNEIHISELQKVLAENVLYGYDVLPSALHLTASTLALRAPETTFQQMHLINMPLGGSEHRLGSLDFLIGERATQRTMDDIFGAFSAVQQVSSKEVIESGSIDPVPVLDLCVMNPPFVRSVGGNLLFGSMPADERAQMQAELKKVVNRVEKAYKARYANITAGLGSVFVLMADRYLRPGSRLALVLPKALLSGVAWQETRGLLQRYYRLEYVIASQDPERWNFSESTDLSEVLVVAVKKAPDEKETDKKVIALNLWRNPTTAVEALASVHELLADQAPDLEGQGSQELYLGSQKVGEALSFAWDNGSDSGLRQANSWILPCAFGQSDLIRAAYHLMKGELWLPGSADTKAISLCQLGELGDLGPDRRDIHDGFNLSDAKTPYPAFWGHDAEAVNTLAQTPNRYLSALSAAKPGRNLRKAVDLWPLSGRVLLAERMWLKTQSMVALRVGRKVLANVWWSLTFNDHIENVEQLEKALVLWLNSTLGLIVLLAYREETRGAWVDFKKPVLLGMPVLNMSKLRAPQIARLVKAYDELAHKPLLPLPMMAQDPVRTEIDAVMSRVLGLPDYSILREMLSQEPVVCLQRFGAKSDGPAADEAQGEPS